MDWQLITTILGVCVIAAGGVGYFYRSRNERRRDDLESKSDLLSYLKAENEGYKAVIIEMKNKMEVMGKEISALRATLTEKDNLLDKYMKIIENRNPELVEILKDIQKFMERIETHIEKEAKDLTIKATVTKGV